MHYINSRLTYLLMETKGTKTTKLITDKSAGYYERLCLLQLTTLKTHGVGVLFLVKSSQVAFNKKAMTIALHVHNVQTIHNVHIVNCAN